MEYLRKHHPFPFSLCSYNKNLNIILIHHRPATWTCISIWNTSADFHKKSSKLIYLKSELINIVKKPPQCESKIEISHEIEMIYIFTHKLISLRSQLFSHLHYSHTIKKKSRNLRERERESPDDLAVAKKIVTLQMPSSSSKHILQLHCN